MELNDYQTQAVRTAIYPARSAILYPAIGMCNEAGEALGKIKKVLRGDHTYWDVQDALIDELGDVAWYLAALARDLGTTLEEVAERNLAKLQDRQDRGVLKGSGDQR